MNLNQGCLPCRWKRQLVPNNNKKVGCTNKCIAPTYKDSLIAVEPIKKKCNFYGKGKKT